MFCFLKVLLKLKRIKIYKNKITHNNKVYKNKWLQNLFINLIKKYKILIKLKITTFNKKNQQYIKNFIVNKNNM